MAEIIGGIEPICRRKSRRGGSIPILGRKSPTKLLDSMGLTGLICHGFSFTFGRQKTTSGTDGTSTGGMFRRLNHVGNALLEFVSIERFLEGCVANSGEIFGGLRRKSATGDE